MGAENTFLSEENSHSRHGKSTPIKLCHNTARLINFCETRSLDATTQTTNSAMTDLTVNTPIRDKISWN